MAYQPSSSLFNKKAARWAASAATVCIICATAEAQAAQLYATDVVYYDNNGTSMASYRENTDNALGNPNLTTDSSNGYSGNKDFLALGLGGRAVFNFGQDFSGDVSLWETTWGSKSRQSQYDERVDIYYGNFDSNVDWDSLANDLAQWTNAGKILNIQDNAYNTALGASNSGAASTGIYNHVLLVDNSQVKRGRDGFDVNAIAVQGVDKQEIPEPTAIIGLLMVGALGTQLRRQQKTA